MVAFLLAAIYCWDSAALAVITAFPTPTHVMTPLFLFTLATFVLEDPKVTSVFAPVTFCVSLEPTFLFSFLFFEPYLRLRLCAAFGWGVGVAVIVGCGVGVTEGVSCPPGVGVTVATGVPVPVEPPEPPVPGVWEELPPPVGAVPVYSIVAVVNLFDLFLDFLFLGIIIRLPVFPVVIVGIRADP